MHARARVCVIIVPDKYRLNKLVRILIKTLPLRTSGVCLHSGSTRETAV